MLDALESKSKGIGKQGYGKLLNTLYALSRLDVLISPKKHKFIKLFISLFPFLYPKLSKWFWDRNGGEEYQEKSIHSIHHITARYTAGKLLKQLKFNNLLEVGCGTGDNLGYLKTLFDKDFTGCDFSEEQIKIAREDTRIKFDLANACKLPYKDKEFDVVLTIGCLAHIPKSKIQQVANELQRVCKNYLIISEEDKDYLHPNLMILEGKSGFHFYHDYKTLFKDFKSIPLNLNVNVLLYPHFYERINMELKDKFLADKISLQKYLKELEQKATENKTEQIRIQGAIIYLEQNLKDYKLEDEACSTQHVK